ncbi:MAG TPA: glucosamine-6-phosphate deaminase [Candidatus Eisenbacteria bacterium]|nr:glucosamine-6-phosphate deaminase [Candidatus Eisenbacteria bacterium]
MSQLQIRILEDKETVGQAAAEQAANSLRQAIRHNGAARIVAATGASQFEFLDTLTSLPGIDWQQVEVFHLDEYVGLPINHPASFRKYLLERLINKTGIKRYHFLDGESDARASAVKIGRELQSAPIDVLFAGIGENAHLAFNDPPADFTTEDPYLIVDLDETCRQQQVNEGWFASVKEVPKQAISMSVRQILRSREIVAVVPDERKAQAVRNSLEGEISPDVPASILRTHPNTSIYLDKNSASLLSSGVPIAR